MSQAAHLTDLAFIRSVLAASEDCIKVLSLDGRLTFMSEGGMRVMEVSDFNVIAGCPWPDFWLDEGNTEARKAIANAAQGKSSRFVGRADTMKGNTRWWDVQVSAILDADGQPKSILSVSRDITELKQAQDQANLLAQEMNHRMRNVLALVQSVVSQTLRTGEDPDVARTKIAERIAAIGKAQDVLTQSSWTGAPLSSVARSVLSAHAEPHRFLISGEELQLDSPRTLAMALALNELAVNAVKHGALSDKRGHVEIGWAVDGAHRFSFVWTERGGPAPVRQPTRTGFGSILWAGQCRAISMATRRWITGLMGWCSR